ncbi:glycosyltransferase family 2 protein [Romboutsia weinsteinii]|uniref:Glycosyltransferase family 2 protein n=1 Tax=Romboutsia weinsteinii TaxID=2020949 RepID=A0A371IYU4_9FIRM|nr:glycosyltransferase family 2 protein [Romboutsia weinsteinii]RDY25648.1 glycosyltransferase family 2 protein [Romboutsia weinsteinii]
MKDNTISVCMITKNEEKNLPRCLESIKDFANEIIIVDTGSTDKTVEIAKKYGAKVYHYKWKKDFSDARNKSLEKATMDWIVFLDADEELPLEECTKLRARINATPYEGLYLRLVNIISDTNLGDAIVLRAFKNKPLYRFRGKMHEQIVFSIQEAAGLDCIESTDVKIIHYGYDPDVADLDAKQKRNLELLESYPESDRDGYFYYSLANEYARIGENDKALEIYYKAMDTPMVNGAFPSFMPYLVVNVARVLTTSKRYIDVINYLKPFEEIYKDFGDPHFFECLAHIECSNFTKAKDALLRYLNSETGSYIYPNSNFEDQFNMGKLLKQLKASCIPHEENLISALIIASEDEEHLVDTVKTVNEIAHEVVIITPQGSNLNKKAVSNVGAKVVESKSDIYEDLFMEGYKQCSGQYILFLKPKEICSLDTQKSLTSYLAINKVESLNLLVVDTLKNVQSNEFRVFKNTELIKKMNNFKDFAKYFDSINTNTVNIYLHKMYE